MWILWPRLYEGTSDTLSGKRKKSVKAIYRLIQLGCMALLLIEVACLSDLFLFEWYELSRLTGVGGIIVIVLVNLALLSGAFNLLFRPSAREHRWIYWTAMSVSTVALLLVVFMADWVFRSNPVSAGFIGTRLVQSAEVEVDFNTFSLVRSASFGQRQALRTVYDRIWVNSPDAYLQNRIGATIDKYAGQYGVDPLLLFYLAFINSFYGEAEAGPIPFLSDMTPETLRDVVQIHLPSWFIESTLRQKIIAAKVHGISPDSSLNFKLHYAFHKATLDVSSQPYDLNTFTDVMLVMQEYPNEFADILLAENGSSLDLTLRQAFTELRGSALQKPYESPSNVIPLGAAYYDKHRASLKRFARAGYYKTALDFDFATRVMALVIKYQRNYFQQELGSEAWVKLPKWQQGAMIAMTRDLFTPGVGKVGYNLYTIPEINCTSLEYVASQARMNPAIMAGTLNSIWRPENPEYLWAGAAYRLRVFHELWYAAYEQEIPGIHREEAIRVARELLTHQTHHR